VRALKEAGTKNPVINARRDRQVAATGGATIRGAVEVLDRAEQHLPRPLPGVDLDLSEVLFIRPNVSETTRATADRMELIRLDGYTEQEKVAIAKDHLLSGVKQAGLKDDESR